MVAFLAPFIITEYVSIYFFTTIGILNKLFILFSFIGYYKNDNR